MVSKCSNPDCSATFRYFHKGKLFRIDTEGGPERRRTMGDDQETRKPLRRLEFYWLCEDCAENMTLVFERGIGVSTRPNVFAQAARA